MEDLTIGIDLGGTFIKSALFDARGTIVERAAIPTEADRGYRHVVARLASLVETLLQGAGAAAKGVRAVGLGCPGPLSHETGVVRGAPNLPGWVNVPVRDDLASAINLPVSLENDANAAAFGEFTAGAGRDARDMVMITLGTGVGGGVVTDGRLLRGHFGNAGEIGHMVIEAGGRPCPCGQRGCLERYCSATSVVDRFREAVESAGAVSPLGARVRAGAAVTARDVDLAARAGDPVAGPLWEDVCRSLALGCVNVQHLFNPEMIVLAGGMIASGSFLLDRVRRYFDELTWKVTDDQPSIEFAALGEDAGIIGNAALARQEQAGS